MRMAPLCWIVLLLSWFTLASASDGPPPADWPRWREARAFYDAGRYEDALKGFLADPSPDSAPFFFNLGNVYHRLGRVGTALAYFEKANKIEPHDAEIRHNLLLARTALGGVIGPDKLDPASNSFERLSDRIALDEVRGTLGLLGLIVCLVWIRSYLQTRNLRNTLLKPGALFALTAFAITASLYLAARATELRPPAIFIEAQTIRSGPGEHFVELGQAPSGTKIRLTGPSITANAPSAEVWQQIRFSPDGIGWVRASSLLLL